MNSRRDFLRLAAAGASTLALSELANAFASRRPIGLQLYTVRKQAEADLPGTLAELRKIGYDEVELYWNVYSHPAKELKKMLADTGLKAPSGHFDYEGLESKLDYANELGLYYMICPMLPRAMWTSADGFKQAAETFNKWGEQAKKRGLVFGFHNHNYEFRKFPGSDGKDQTGFDILTSRTDPKLVKLEMDCYWITQAGEDPLKMLGRFGKRIRLLHIKDRKPGFPPSQEMGPAAEHFTEVGNGSIDWKAILAKADKLGIWHTFVEQDESADPMESVRISYKNFKTLLA